MDGFEMTDDDDEVMDRFERIDDDVEHVEQYVRGGYHPVHLNAIFNDRYEVIGKLGHGVSSTVWLVKDHQFVLALTICLLGSCPQQQLTCRS